MSLNSTQQAAQEQPPSSAPTSIVLSPVRPSVVGPVAADSTPTPATAARPTTVNDPRSTGTPIATSTSSSGSSFFSQHLTLIIGIGAGLLVLAIILAAVIRTRKKRARTHKLIQKTLEEAEKARIQDLNRRGDRPSPSPSPSMASRYAPPPLSRGGSQSMQSPYRGTPSAAPSPQLTYSQGPYYQNASPALQNYGGAPPTSQSSRFPPSQGYTQPRSSIDRFGAPPQTAAYGYGAALASPKLPPDAYRTDYIVDSGAPYDDQYDAQYEGRQGNEYDHRRQNYAEYENNNTEPYNKVGADYLVAAEEPGAPQPVTSTTVYLDPPTKMYAQ